MGDDPQQALLDAILPHVAFDGWSEAAFAAALSSCEVDASLARAICPRGAVDLACFYHKSGDNLMIERLRGEDSAHMKIREKITHAVRCRIEAISDKEAARRAVTLFALPPYAADGARLIWETSDKIWINIGDTSDDFNWYSKRATLSAVYSSTFLYWLGDQSEDQSATWAFLDRRISDVMQFEKLKAQCRQNPVAKRVFALPLWALSKVRAPMQTPDFSMPGRFDATE